ncbi:hypothetical protein MFLAVUS_011493 [Mucor flavus]|uniref:Uncharacterized protein n=1 Tax=Mucor flavus TaxID=439312 RepID=A0ABP9ZFS8_9FUNG
MNAVHFEDRLDLQLNGLFKDPTGIKHPIVVDMSLGNSGESTLMLTQDIDAFIAYGLVKCYISFPGMYLANINVGGSSSQSEDSSEDEDATTFNYLFLSTLEQQQFVDKLFLPAIRQCCGDYNFTNISSSFAMAVNTYGYSDEPKEFLTSDILKGAINIMRLRTDTEPLLRKYKGFFVSCSSFGSKQDFFGDIVFDDILGSGLIDWSVLDKTKVLIDVATTVTNTSRVSSIFIKHNCKHVVAGIYNIRQDEKKRMFQSALSTFGGI